MDDARHFFPFLPVAFGLGIAIYFVWPSEKKMDRAFSRAHRKQIRRVFGKGVSLKSRDHLKFNIYG